MKFKDIAFWFMLIAVIALAVYVLTWTKSEGFKCLNDPGVYFIKNSEKVNGETSCTCSTIKGASVILNNKGLQPLASPQNQNNPLAGVNFSDIKIK